jgi:uncharacterized membrane protein YjfL (UPF0719 family)
VLESVGYATAYAAVGLALLVFGYVVWDLLTPGKLVQRIWEERSINAAIVLATGYATQGGVIFTSIWSHGAAGFGDALAWTIVFSLLGLLLQAVAFLLLDLLTPGKLGDIVCERALHPASLVMAGAQVAVGLIVIASIA